MNIWHCESWKKTELNIKAKYLWTYWKLKSKGARFIFVDQFNVTESSIKQYNWTTRGKQNFWFWPKRHNKVNWIIAVSEDEPFLIATQIQSYKADRFSEFMNEVVCKLRSTNSSLHTMSAVVYDNAPIHRAKVVQDKLKDLKQLAIWLPAYTPEWNPAEVAINIIKSRIDRKIKRSK